MFYITLLAKNYKFAAGPWGVGVSHTPRIQESRILGKNENNNNNEFFHLKLAKNYSYNC